MSAMNDYVIRMAADELPPTEVFWSLTLYDLINGFFIPNDHKKYSVGENAGMKLDENMDIVLRAYVPDLEKMKTWQAPRAEKLEKK
jgi:hypothetical protein